VPRPLGIGSVWLASICLVLTRSPVIVVVALAVAVAALVLYFLRRAPAAGRWMLQLGFSAAALFTVIMLWATREQVFGLLRAGAELNVRTSLWDEMIQLMPLHPLEGWGWAGIWPSSTPYGWLEFTTGRDYSSGLNAYLDVYFQVGLVGALAFVALVGLAFVRSWLLASNKRSLVYVWPALVLVVLIVTSLAESTVLVEYGWFLLLVCSVRAAQGLSWRSALARKPDKLDRP
jgi:O-antigen ligase